LTSRFVQDLLSYSKEREPEFRPCFPNKIAEDVCELMQEVAGENDVAIEKKFSESIGEMVMDSLTISKWIQIYRITFIHRQFSSVQYLRIVRQVLQGGRSRANYEGSLIWPEF